MNGLEATLASWHPRILSVLRIMAGLLLLQFGLAKHFSFPMTWPSKIDPFGHAPKSFYPIQNGGTLAIIFCFVFFYLFFAGGGPWSVDAMRSNKA
jgi:putative oxidoreductase